jgi:hypothetical protein
MPPTATRRRSLRARVVLERRLPQSMPREERVDAREDDDAGEQQRERGSGVRSN